jgi:phosphohistidine phosphatase SixA
MAELDTIAEILQRHRRDIDSCIESSSSRAGETDELVRHLQDLRRRTEETLRRFQVSADESRIRKSR